MHLVLNRHQSQNQKSSEGLPKQGNFSDFSIDGIPGTWHNLLSRGLLLLPFNETIILKEIFSGTRQDTTGTTPLA